MEWMLIVTWLARIILVLLIGMSIYAVSIILERRDFFKRYSLEDHQNGFIDLNDNTTCDLGSGNGFPALVIAIIAKNMKKNIKIIMHEKSPNKCRFLKDVSNDLGLQTKIIQEDIFKLKNIKTGTVMSRAFKPLPIILELIYQNFSSYKNIILFMGENGNELLNQALLKWDIEFVKKKSLTNRNSFLLNIKKLRKLN